MPNTTPETNIPEVPVFLSASALARRLGVCQMTLRRRVAAGVVKPDAVLIQGTVFEGSLFDASKLQTIRQAMRGVQIVS